MELEGAAWGSPDGEQATVEQGRRRRAVERRAAGARRRRRQRRGGNKQDEHEALHCRGYVAGTARGPAHVWTS